MTQTTTPAQTAPVGPSGVHALLADGTTVLIRPAQAADRSAVRAMFATLSQESVHPRFSSMGTGPGEDAARRLCAPAPERIALLAIVSRAGDEDVVGEGEAWRLGDTDTAEVAFTVAEDMRGKGVGTLLLEHLADAARARGFRRFAAETSNDHFAMKRVIAAAGLRHRAAFVTGGTVFHDIDLTEDDAYLDVVADREFHASAASLQPLFRPRAVAVIGAGRSPGGVGRTILDHVVESGFDGRLFTVNPKADEIAGVPCAHSVQALPRPVDLAVIALPAEAVVETAIACGRHGIRALTVVTSPVPASVATVLKAVCRRFGMRLVGPNCLGVASFGPGVALDATFAADIPLGGSAGVGVQSGGVGIAILDHLSRLGIGVGSFASLGDKADVSGNDLLAWWSRDPETKLALLHLESFGNPRKFARYARRVSRTKPVLTVAAGRSEAGSRAAASHTAAAVTPSVTRDALYRQAGVIATRSVAELAETAALLASQPLPAGRRVAIVSNAGGTGVLAADACTEAGLTVVQLSPRLQGELSALLGPVAAVANPVDAGAAAGAAGLRSAVAAISASGEADAVLLLLVPTALADLRPALLDGIAHGDRPLLAVAVDQAASVEMVTAVNGEHIPVYGDAENAARALAHAVAHARWRRAPAGRIPDVPGVRSEEAARLVSRHLDAHPDGGWLAPDQAAELLACYGIRCARLVLARDEQTAATAAAAWDGPVALKAYWPELVHKSDVGGVLLGVDGEAAVREGWRELQRRFGERLAGVVVQEMAPHGVELLAGVDSDAVFGPLVGFGAGGTETDLIADHGFRLTPMTEADADSLIAGTTAARLLAGYRGRPAADVNAVRDVLLRLARLAAEQPCVTEAEINPLIATPDGAIAADFRIRVQSRSIPDPYLRRLR